VRLTRRQFVAGGAAALGAAGIYELVDRFATAPARQTTRVLPSEQHVLGRPQVIVDNGVEVVVPPLHHEVVTAALRVEPTKTALDEARATLSETLQELDARYEPAPKGVSISIGWGPWSDIGLAAARRDRGARLERVGLGSLSPEQGVQAFTAMLGSDRTHQAIMIFDAEAWSVARGGAPDPFLGALVRPSAARPDAGGAALPDVLRAAPGSARLSLTHPGFPELGHYELWRDGLPYASPVQDGAIFAPGGHALARQDPDLAGGSCRGDRRFARDIADA